MAFTGAFYFALDAGLTLIKIRLGRMPAFEIY